MKKQGEIRAIRLAAAVLLASGSVVAQPQYKTTDFPVSSLPIDINNRGQIIAPFGDGGTVIWENGLTTYIGTSVTAAAINAAGALAGGNYFWKDGLFTILGPLGRLGAARGLNDRGQVVGGTSDGDLNRKAFLWQDGRMIWLPRPASWPLLTVARAINDAGEIAGSWFDYDAGMASHAMVWRVNGAGSKMTFTDIGAALASQLGRDVSSAWAINSRGQVVGEMWGTRWDSGPLDGFVWDRGSVTVLPRFRARGINARGQVVGSVMSRAALWEPPENGSTGKIILLDVPRESDSGAIAINDAGTIIGWYTASDGKRGFIATREE